MFSKAILLTMMLDAAEEFLNYQVNLV